MIKLSGKVSCFGGPDDGGVAANEGLAIYSNVDQCNVPGMFLTTQPNDTTGLARRLNPGAFYVACRWDYNYTPVEWLRHAIIYVENPKNGLSFACHAVDWGPNADTGRIADLSPALLHALDLETDGVVLVKIAEPGDALRAYSLIARPHKEKSTTRAMMWAIALACIGIGVWVMVELTR